MGKFGHRSAMKSELLPSVMPFVFHISSHRTAVGNLCSIRLSTSTRLLQSYSCLVIDQ